MRKTARRGQDADEQDGRRCKKRNGGQETNARARNEQEETPPTTRQRTGLNDLLGVADVLVDDRIFGRVDGRTLGRVDDHIVDLVIRTSATGHDSTIWVFRVYISQYNNPV